MTVVLWHVDAGVCVERDEVVVWGLSVVEGGDEGRGVFFAGPKEYTFNRFDPPLNGQYLTI